MSMKLTRLLAPVTLLLLAPRVHADTVPAAAGHPWTAGGPTPFKDTCFSNPAWDVVTNNCDDTATHTWIIPLQVSAPSFPTTYVTIARGPAFSPSGLVSGSVTCHAISIDATNTQWMVSAPGYNNFTTLKTISMGQLGNPAILQFGVLPHGTLHVECVVQMGARVLSAELTQ